VSDKTYLPTEWRLNIVATAIFTVASYGPIMKAGAPKAT
jgi:hypothetical protein